MRHYHIWLDCGGGVMRRAAGAWRVRMSAQAWAGRNIDGGDWRVFVCDDEPCAAPNEPRGAIPAPPQDASIGQAFQAGVDFARQQG